MSAIFCRFSQSLRFGLLFLLCAFHAPAHTFTGHPAATMAHDAFHLCTVDGNEYPRTAAGVQAAVNACGADSEVWLTPGKYTFGSTSVTISTLRTHIRGSGKWATEIDFCGGAVRRLPSFSRRARP
jgi:hypothetical protein